MTAVAIAPATGLTSGRVTPKVRLSMLRQCTIPFCPKPRTTSATWCPMHEARWRRHGDPSMSAASQGETPLYRVFRRVEITPTCWLFVGHTDKQGYGKVSPSLRVHRVVYGACVEPLDPLLVIDHLCRVRNCVNPEHLEQVASEINTLRGYGTGGRNSRKAVAKCGHPFDALYRATPNKKWRVCTRCSIPSVRRLAELFTE